MQTVAVDINCSLVTINRSRGWREFGGHRKRIEGRKRHMRRGNSEEYLTKKEPYKKLSVDSRKILRVLEEENSCRYGELVERTKIPKGTIDRRLSFLKSLGLITSVKRKWVLVARTKTYKNYEEYRIHLGHSKQLVKGILAINEFVPPFLPKYDFYEGDILSGQESKLKLRSSSEMWLYALQHLKTGYPDIFNLFEKCSSLLDQIQHIGSGYGKKRFENLEKEPLDIQSAGVKKNLSAEGTNNIYEKSESPPNPTKEERLKLEEAAKARSELEDQLTKIIWRVVNGEPLSGRCNQCPEVDIGKKSGQKDSRENV